MKRMKFILPLLAAWVLLLTPMCVQAAKETLPAGTREATITITLKNLLSCEGWIDVRDKDGVAVSFDNVTAECDKPSICGASDNQIFMVSSGEPVTLTVTVDITVKADGTYYVYFDGGKTDAEGKYTDYSENKKYLETVTVVVGDGESDQQTGEGDSDKDNENNTAGGNTDDNTDNSTNNNNSGSNTNDNNSDSNANNSGSGSTDSNGSAASESDKTNTGNTGTGNGTAVVPDKNNGEVDYSLLEQALKDADAVISGNAALKEWQSLINGLNNGTMLLSSDDQELVDEAAREIQAMLAEMKEDTDTQNTGKSKNSSSFNFDWLSKIAKYWMLIAAIILVLLIVIITLLLRKKRKKKPETKDYEGAPMVDYDIADDD